MLSQRITGIAGIICVCSACLQVLRSLQAVIGLVLVYAPLSVIFWGVRSQKMLM